MNYFIINHKRTTSFCKSNQKGKCVDIFHILSLKVWLIIMNYAAIHNCYRIFIYKLLLLCNNYPSRNFLNDVCSDEHFQSQHGIL